MTVILVKISTYLTIPFTLPSKRSHHICYLCVAVKLQKFVISIPQKIAVVEVILEVYSLQT